MLAHPSHASKQCSKPLIPVNEINTFSIEEIKHRFKQNTKELTPVNCKGAIVGVFRKPKMYTVQSLEKLQFCEKLVEKGENTPSQNSFYDKIQSILSYSVQIDDEERLLLKSIQLDVCHAINKYQTKMILHNQSTKKPIVVNDVLRNSEQKQALHRSFIVDGKKQRQLSMTNIEQKKSIERVTAKQSRSQSQKSIIVKSTNKKKKPSRQQNKENLNNNTTFQKKSLKPNFSSIKEVKEYSSTKKEHKSTLQKTPPMKMYICLYDTKQNQSSHSQNQNSTHNQSSNYSQSQSQIQSHNQNLGQKQVKKK